MIVKISDKNKFKKNVTFISIVIVMNTIFNGLINLKHYYGIFILVLIVPISMFITQFLLKKLKFPVIVFLIVIFYMMFFLGKYFLNVFLTT